GATLTDSNFAGTILSGAAITLTGGMFHGNAYAKADVSITGTNFSVVMTGGDPCNVTWWTAEAATIKDTDAGALHPFVGTILAGTEITTTGAATDPLSFTGDAFAKIAVTMTDTHLVGCEGGKGKGKDKEKCNQGVGNGPEGCDPGNSNHRHGSNDENGGTPGDPGRKGGH
ncbi:MAG TPA: ice-binding family protein, partial [Gemmatimonadaceae bacterium]|nr:ice-binding family protein [Gemmatimonadaceae bacterium]